MKNYIGNNNEINKKKYKKSRPPKLNPDAGNVEYNIDVFNKMNDIDIGMNSAAGMNGCSENIDKKGDYSVKTLKEALNRLDHYCLDNDKKFYDLRSMYEAVQPNLTADQKNKVKELANKGNVEAIKNYLALQDPDVQRVLKTKKNLKTSAYVQEEINESANNLTYDELIDLAHKYYKQGGMEIIEFWDEDSLREYEKEFGPMTKKQAIRLMKVMGNVSDDEEEAGRYFSKQTYSDETDVDFDESLNESVDADGWEKPYSWTAMIRKDNFILEPRDPYKDGDNDSWHVSQIMHNSKNKYKNHGNFNSKQDAKDYVDKILNKRLKSKTAVADWSDETDVDFDESLNESNLVTPFRKDIELLAKKAAEATTEDELNRVLSSLLPYNRDTWSHYSQMIADKEYSIPAIGKMISDDLYWELQSTGNNFEEFINFNDSDIQYTDVDFDESLNEGVYRYTVECYDNPYDDPTRHRFYDYEDAERFAVDCVKSKKYTDVIITSPRRYGISVKNSWSKQGGWYKEPSFLIEFSNDDIHYTDADFDESLNEDTVKQGNKWVNKGNSGKTHGKFKTKKAADAQRRAMFANGYRAESLDEANQKKNQYFTVMFFHVGDDDVSTHTGIMYGKDEKDIRSKFEQYCPSCKIDRVKKGVLGFDYPMITSSFEYDMGWKEEEEYDYDEDEDLVSLDDSDIKYTDDRFNESLKKLHESNDQDLLDLQVALYKALRSIGGDVDNYESVIKSRGYEERIIISFDTECDEYVSGIKYKKLAEKKIKEVLNSSKFNQDIDIDIYQKFRSYDDVDYPMEVRSRWFNVGITAVSFNNLMEETKKPKSKILYVIKDKHGNQLSAPTEDDDELWDRVTQMENRGRRGLKVVVYKTEKITESDNSYRGFIIKHRPSDGKTGVVVHVYKDGKLIFTADDDEEAKSDIDNMLNEDYTEADDVWGDPYTFEEVEDQLKDLTNNFSEKDGIVRCWYEQEKVFGVQILKKHYKIVEVSDGRGSDDEDMSWVISYATPKRK